MYGGPVWETLRLRAELYKCYCPYRAHRNTWTTVRFENRWFLEEYAPLFAVSYRQRPNQHTEESIDNSVDLGSLLFHCTKFDNIDTGCTYWVSPV